MIHHYGIEDQSSSEFRACGFIIHANKFCDFYYRNTHKRW